MSDLRMPDLNQVTVAGRLTYDPELKHTAAGKPYTRFGIANTRHFKGSDGERREDTAFINGTIWGTAAEWMAERLKKGRPVLVEGSLKSNEWEDKDGKKRRDLTINAQKVTPLDWDEDRAEGQNAAPRATQAAEQAHEAVDPDEDCPF